MSQAVRINGAKIVAVGKHSRFDPSKPEEATLNSLTLIDPDKDGFMSDYWAAEGYIQVGTAKVEVELMRREDMTANAVTSLRKQKTDVLAKAQLEATRIEQQIQSLLAITNEVQA